MICICGYRYETKVDVDTGKEILLGGVKPFVKIEVAARAMSSWAGMMDIGLYACPACGTVRIEHWR